MSTGPTVQRRDVVIVGAGPAGLAAAETLARTGRSVVIFEQMPSAGRKFLMAGRGGLNLTHSEPLEDFLPRYMGPCAARVCAAVTSYSPTELRNWAEGLGQKTFAGSSGRVFPDAMKASPLLRSWLTRLNELGVTLHTRHTWTGWDANGHLVVMPEEGAALHIHARAVILALGGASWPRLGSDGAWAQTLIASGIPVTPLRPSNAGLRISWSEHYRSRFSGQPLKRIAVSFDGVTQRGEAVVTRTGLEGGAVYALSSRIASAVEPDQPVSIEIDLKPDQTAAKIASRLARAKAKDSLSNKLRKVLMLAPAAVALLREVRRDLPAEPMELARLIKQLPLPVAGVSGLERAISTAGGVARSACDDAGMLLSRPGTFVAGEMMDWDAPTGGYLLQASIATGIAAARGVLSFGGPGAPPSMDASTGSQSAAWE